MKRRQILVRVMTLALVLALGAELSLAQEPTTPTTVAAQSSPLGTAFTYQGQIRRDGNPINGTCDFQFSLWDAASGGTQIGATETKAAVNVSNGLFTVLLDFGGAAFNGEARWLEVSVRSPAGNGSYTTLSPRQALTPAPYALALPGLYTQQNAISPNIIGGYRGNSVGAGVYGATIGGGGGIHSIESGQWLDLPNTVGGSWSTVGGGAGNTARGNAATVGGGGGSYLPSTQFLEPFGNLADGAWTTVAGGGGNTANGVYATVGGGVSNRAGGKGAVVAGGGGFDGEGKPQGNTALGDYATVSGGAANTASGFAAVVGGGGGILREPPPAAFLVGNVASGNWATVAGGSKNEAAADYATIGGGVVNAVRGEFATVPGGQGNVAEGDYSFAAGRYAKALHDGSFVWADSTDAEFVSTAQDQFAVRAKGGVIFEVGSADGMAIHGDLEITGNLAVNGQVSGFPRPNFDSGWVPVEQGSSVTITHNLGGNPEDYVVDMTFRDNFYGSGIHQITYGSDVRPGPEAKGMFWEALTAISIRVVRQAEDARCQEVRIRIWVYK